MIGSVFHRLCMYLPSDGVHLKQSFELEEIDISRVITGLPLTRLSTGKHR